MLPCNGVGNFLGYSWYYQLRRNTARHLGGIQEGMAKAGRRPIKNQRGEWVAQYLIIHQNIVLLEKQFLGD